VKSREKTLDPNTNQWVTTEIKYYIHSSVIGQVLTEVNEWGSKQRTFVYAGGKILAIQVIDANQEVVWEHYDPSDGSYRETDIQGNSIVSAEMDPMGADAGLIKPLTWPPPSSPGKLELYYSVPQLDSASNCVLDGMQVPCDVLTSENSRQCPKNQCRVFNPKLRNGEGGISEYHAYSDGREGYLRLGWSWTGNAITTPSGISFSFIDGADKHLLNRDHADSLPQNPLVTNDPKSLPGKGNSKDCNISVSFEQGTSFSGDATLKNGPGVLGGGFPFFGLGFTVSGFAKGGIGKIGDQVNPENPKGSWTMDQWVWDYIQTNNGVERNDAKSHRDISPDIAYSATNNNFSWYDHPDGGGSDYFRKAMNCTLD
jgi:hypothetical protein